MQSQLNSTNNSQLQMFLTYHRRLALFPNSFTTIFHTQQCAVYEWPETATSSDDSNHRPFPISDLVYLVEHFPPGSASGAQKRPLNLP